MKKPKYTAAFTTKMQKAVDDAYYALRPFLNYNTVDEEAAIIAALEGLVAAAGAPELLRDLKRALNYCSPVANAEFRSTIEKYDNPQPCPAMGDDRPCKAGNPEDRTLCRYCGGEVRQ